MKRFCSILAFLMVTLLTGCTNQQIKEAIDECKNDPDCYVIIDEQVDEVLESKGIQSDSMTNIEMDSVFDLIDDYIGENYYSEKDITVFKEYYDAILTSSSEEDLVVLLDALNAIYNSDIARNLEDFLEVNTEYKQYIVNDGIKYLVYKESYNRFILEITSDVIHKYTIDLDLNKIYYGDQAMYLDDPDFESYLDGRFDTNDTTIFTTDNGGFIMVYHNALNKSITVVFSSGSVELSGEMYIGYEENLMYLSCDYIFQGIEHRLETEVDKLHTDLTTTYTDLIGYLHKGILVTGDVNEPGYQKIIELFTVLDKEITLIFDEEYRDGYYLQVYGYDNQLLFDDDVDAGVPLFQMVEFLDTTASDDSMCFVGWNFKYEDTMPEEHTIITAQYKNCTDLKVSNYQVKDVNGVILSSEEITEGTRLDFKVYEIDYRIDNMCFHHWENQNIMYMPNEDLILNPIYVDCNNYSEYLVSNIYVNYEMNEDIVFTGYVIGFAQRAYFLSDGVQVILVYDGPEKFQYGDIVTIQGTISKYYEAYEITNISDYSIISRGNHFNNNTIELSVDELNLLDSTDPLIYSYFYTTTGTLEMVATNSFNLNDGDDFITITFTGISQNYVLQEHDKETIIIDLFFYTTRFNEKIFTFGTSIFEVIADTSPDE